MKDLVASLMRALRSRQSLARVTQKYRLSAKSWGRWEEGSSRIPFQVFVKVATQRNLPLKEALAFLGYRGQIEDTKSLVICFMGQKKLQSWSAELGLSVPVLSRIRGGTKVFYLDFFFELLQQKNALSFFLEKLFVDSPEILKQLHLPQSTIADIHRSSVWGGAIYRSLDIEKFKHFNLVEVQAELANYLGLPIEEVQAVLNSRNSLNTGQSHVSFLEPREVGIASRIYWLQRMKEVLQKRQKQKRGVNSPVIWGLFFQSVGPRTKQKIEDLLHTCLEEVHDLVTNSQEPASEVCVFSLQYLPMKLFSKA